MILQCKVSCKNFQPEVLTHRVFLSLIVSCTVPVLAVGSLDASVDDNEAERRAIMVTKRRRTRHSRGLFFEGANEVMQKFTKVSVTKQRVSSKEQVCVGDRERKGQGIATWCEVL